MLSDDTSSRTTLDGEPELMTTSSSMPALYGKVGVSATDEYALALMADRAVDKKYDVVGGVVGLNDAVSRVELTTELDVEENRKCRYGPDDKYLRTATPSRSTT